MLRIPGRKRSLAGELPFEPVLSEEFARSAHCERIRVEHWVVTEHQGQVAADNILGRRERFDAVPFFCSQHYDVAINYVGHAEKWDAIEIDGSLDARDCAVAYKKGGRTLATVTISRDLQSWQAETAMEAAIRSAKTRGRLRDSSPVRPTRQNRAILSESRSDLGLVRLVKEFLRGS